MLVRPALSRLVVAATLAATLLLTVLIAPSATSVTPAATAAKHVIVTNGCVLSVPEPGTTAKVKICYTLFEPSQALSHPVPLIFHSHGFGGSRTTTAAAFKPFTDVGFGVLSFDQRGFGQSGGLAHFENPDIEGRDVVALVHLVAGLTWVRQDGPGDPRLGAIGASYGGAYQFLGAFEGERHHHKPIFDALAPEETWHDFSESLAPSGVVRTAWAAALAANGVKTGALPSKLYKALVESSATGTEADGNPTGTEDLVSYLRRNGPLWQLQHTRRLNIPMLIGQGTTDTLFPLEQGFQNFADDLTTQARARSIFIGYNGGHTQAADFPRGISVTSDPCSVAMHSATFRRIAIRFFQEQLQHKQEKLTGYGEYHIATPTDTCSVVKSVAANTAVRIADVTTTEAAGAPVGVLVATGPINIAGSPYLTGDVTALGTHNRAFYGLAIGPDPADAHLVQDNVLPFTSVSPLKGVPHRIALPSVAVNVPQGENLYLLPSSQSEVFTGTGSRSPGTVIIDHAVVHLPVMARGTGS